ncbi:MAG TPA: peptidylprolyl isomerase [Chloroflexota bacterium]|nr:peptidylprolyl isomerase [Chloroflexota bacterium]
MSLLRLVLLAVGVLAVGCSSTASARPTPQPTIPARTAVPSAATGGGATAGALSGKQWSSPPPMTIDPSKQYTAVIHTNKGDITVQLFADEVPQTVNNFVFLSREDFYDNAPFHRIIKDFMIQTGDGQRGNGTGGPGYRFADEPVKRDYDRGIVAMANAGPNTNGSQFFIMQGNRPLPKNYTIFGKVTDGMNVVDAIANTPVRPSPQGEPSVPTEDVHITHVDIQES